MNLGEIVEKEVKASTPIIMCSVSGYDASIRVEDLATELNKPLTSIAIGKDKIKDIGRNTGTMKVWVFQSNCL